MYWSIYRRYSVGFAYISSFCNAVCCSAENIVVVVIMMMMCRRRKRGYLRTVTFESVHKPPHLLLHSSISVHCHTVNSLFMLPHSMLTVLYRNVLHVISLIRRNSNCCEAQNLPFSSWTSTSQCNKSHLQKTENHKLVCFIKKHHILISAACYLVVPLSHNGSIVEFWI